MASAKLRRKGGGDKFLSPEQTRTIKPGDLKNYAKLKDLSQDDLIELLSLMEAELQAKDVILKAILSSEAGIALPLSHLLNDGAFSKTEEEKPDHVLDEEDEVWLGEPSAHLNHVVAYHQVVREQMQSIVTSLQKQHKQVVDQLDEERHKHAVDTAQGHDVTYMLEKQRELLKHQLDEIILVVSDLNHLDCHLFHKEKTKETIEVEQAKYVALEKERDGLLNVIEQERNEQYNTFNNLINDCKAFALQLVTQSTKHQKEIDKEKQKNKLLSELMVEETQKFKEKIKQLEDEVGESRLLEQKKTDLEQKLVILEKKYKETFRQVDEERLVNRKLTFHMNQLRQHLPADLNKFDEEDDILYIQNQVEIPIKEAGISSILISNKEERESPEPSILPPAAPLIQPVKISTVQKSSCVKQNNTMQYSPKLPSPQFPHAPPPPPPPISNHVISSNSSTDYSKRHSYEDRKYPFDYQHYDDQPPMRNSYENISHMSYDAGQMAQIRSTNTVRHNSYEEVRNIGSVCVEPKRNSYEGDSTAKKTPPPAPPPRRGSTLSYAEKPPIVKIPQQLQPRRSNQQTNMAHIQTRPGCPTDNIPLMLLIVCDYGWEYQKDYGVSETNRMVDFLSIIHVGSNNTWQQLTSFINRSFEKECPVFLNDDKTNSAESISKYEYGDVVWSMEEYPEISFSEIISEQLHPIIIRLKGPSEGCLHDLSYSTMTPVSSLEECLRIAYQEKRLMLTVNEEMEGKYFAACFSHWIKMSELRNDVSCSIIKFEPDGSSDLMNLTNTLLTKGILQKSTRKKLNERFILILNIDLIENEDITSLVFDWLTYDPERTKIHNLNGYNNSKEDNCFLNKDVIILAYATNGKLNSLPQQAYRIFKIMKLPPILPGLVQSWLRQKIIEHAPQQARDLYMMETVKWLSNVYQSLHKNASTIDLTHKMPDISVYLGAPLSNSSELYEWVKELWSENIVKCVEQTIRYRSNAASLDQQDILVKAALTTLLEKAIRPGCPFDLDL